MVKYSALPHVTSNSTQFHYSFINQTNSFSCKVVNSFAGNNIVESISIVNMEMRAYVVKRPSKVP